MAPRQTLQEKVRELNESAPYLFESDRLSTFKGFAFDKVKGAVCTSEKVAKAGFYCTDKTSGKCPFCLKELEFEAEDDPWAEHASRQKDCAFVKLGKLDDSLWTVQDAVTLAIHSITMAKYEQHIGIVTQWRKELATDVLIDKLAKMGTEPAKTRTK